MGNLWKVAPLVGVLFLFQALSLAGLPPLSGFWGKYMIVVVGFGLKNPVAYVLVACSILAGIWTLVSMLKIWLTSFWRVTDAVPVAINTIRWKLMTAVVVLMTFVSLTIGLGANMYMGIAERAATMAMDQAGYVERVLGIGVAESQDQIEYSVQRTAYSENWSTNYELRTTN